MKTIRLLSCCVLLIALALFIYTASLGGDRVEQLLFNDLTPTPVVCAHQLVVVNGDDLSYFAVTEKACGR